MEPAVYLDSVDSVARSVNCPENRKVSTVTCSREKSMALFLYQLQQREIDKVFEDGMGMGMVTITITEAAIVSYNIIA